MNGIFLLALGAVWSEVRLASTAKMFAYWAALYGTYVNWLATTLAPFLALRRCPRSQAQVIPALRGKRS
jgi:hypothetical protein